MTRRRTLRALRRVQRGYTIVELLMSLSVLAIGVSGVIAMQRVTLEANRHAKDLATATRIAEAWADQLTTDGTLWTVNAAGTGSTLGFTTWLVNAPASGIGSWSLPAYSSSLGFGPAFGPLGQPRDPTDHPELDHFCTHIRLSWLQSDVSPTIGNGVIRAQIRVFWPRDDQAAAMPSGDICTITPVTFANSIGAFHVVYLTTSIRQVPAGRAP